jgi:hypothetical protein
MLALLFMPLGQPKIIGQTGQWRAVFLLPCLAETSPFRGSLGAVSSAGIICSIGAWRIPDTQSMDFNESAEPRAPTPLRRCIPWTSVGWQAIGGPSPFAHGLKTAIRTEREN